MTEKQILQTLKDAYEEFFLWLDKQNAESEKKGHSPIEPSFGEFMTWLEEEKLN
ncbi:MAG: hypothetical protein ABFQ62_03685 [Patescibacteria group bacterium]